MIGCSLAAPIFLSSLQFAHAFAQFGERLFAPAKAFD
jgi:hypothetical protein